MGSIFFFK